MDTGAACYRRFLDGDESGFDDLVKLYRESLVLFLYRYVRNTAVAEDIAADAFVELLVHKHRYNFRYSLKTYLFTIGRNKALDYLRHERRFGSEPLSEAEHVSGEDEIAEILNDESKLALHRAIGRLSPEYRTAVHLVYFEDMSYDDAARVMRKSAKQVSNMLYRARKELRIALESEGFEP